MFGVDRGFAQFYGGTSLLIMVGVVLDTLQQIEGYLLNRHYDGLMKGGARIKGKKQYVVMVKLKTKEEIDLIRKTSKILINTHCELAKLIKTWYYFCLFRYNS